MIRSVLGRIDPAQLGVTLLHGHSTSDPDALTTELDAFRLAGGNTVIEARPASSNERLAEEPRVNIVRFSQGLTYLLPDEPCQAFREMDRLQAQGTDLRKLAVHSADDRLANLEALCSIAVRGAWLAIEARIPAWQRSLKRLIEAGWAGQLLVATRQCGTLDDSINSIRTAGFSHDLVDDLLVRNPRRYLAADPR